jgi:hypothetical protein
MAGPKLSLGAPKGGIKKVATPPSREFVLGSRPPGLRAPPIQRIKPQAGMTQYGKTPASATPAGANAGDTGQTPWS